jgi:hypothetical protein
VVSSSIKQSKNIVDDFLNAMMNNSNIFNLMHELKKHAKAIQAFNRQTLFHCNGISLVIIGLKHIHQDQREPVSSPYQIKAETKLFY